MMRVRRMIRYMAKKVASEAPSPKLKKSGALAISGAISVPTHWASIIVVFPMAAPGLHDELPHEHHDGEVENEINHPFSSVVPEPWPEA